MLLVLLLSAGVTAEEFKKVKKTWQIAIANADKKEKSFWKEVFKKGEREAYVTYAKEWNDNWGLPSGKKEVHYNFEPFRDLKE